MRRSAKLRRRYGHANPRPKSHGFIVIETRTGAIRSPLVKRRKEARELLFGYVNTKGALQPEPGYVEYLGGLWYVPLGIHQVKLYPGETYSPETYKP